jgi:integrase
MAVRKRGRSFVADYYDGQGTRRWKAFKLERDAKIFEGRVRGEIARGEHVPEAEMPRFSEVAERFAESKRGKVRDLTLDHYETAIATYLNPYLGRLRLNRISVALIERFRTELREGLPESVVQARAERLAALAAERAAHVNNPKLAKSVGYFRNKLARVRISPTTLNKQLTLLAMVFNYALKHRLVTFNPAEHVDKLPAAYKEGDAIDQNVLDADEVKKLLAAAAPEWRLLLETAVTTGLRQSELLGLQWGDVDWQSSRLHIRRSLREGRFYDTKSKNSRRIVEIPSSLAHELKVWRLKCPKGAHDLVFPNSEGNPMDAANLIHRGFEPAVRRAGLRKIRFHDLRHTAASLLLANGVDVVAVSRLLGHSSPIVTLNIYSHAIPKERAGLTDRLANLFGSKPVADDVERDESSGGVDRNLLFGLVGRAGLEPATNGLKVQCSTN